MNEAYAQSQQTCTQPTHINIWFQNRLQISDKKRPERFSFQEIRHHQMPQCIKRSTHWHCIVTMCRVASVRCRNLLHCVPGLWHAELTKFQAAQETSWSGLSRTVFRQLPYHPADNLSCSRERTTRMATAPPHQSKHCSISRLNM